MTTSMMINGMMVFFTLVLVAAVAAPVWLVLPRWMETVRDRRIAFHAAAVEALATELARPQSDLQHAARLLEQRRRNIAALLSLDPGAKVPPLHGENWRQAA
jgi:hypothetical protein